MNSATPLPSVMRHDGDPDETGDWLESLDEVIERDGMARAEYLVDCLIEAGRRAGGRFHTRHTTPYRNTIPVDAQPPYPGDLDLEARITAIHRWNALAMVSRANRAHPEPSSHTRRPASTRVPSSRGGSTRDAWTTSAARSAAVPSRASPPTRTRR